MRRSCVYVFGFDGAKHKDSDRIAGKRLGTRNKLIECAEAIRFSKKAGDVLV